VQISGVDASLILVARECCDTSGLACLAVSWRSWLGSVFIKAIERKKKARSGRALSDLCPSCRVVSRR
jgi:hypothetical protein